MFVKDVMEGKVVPTKENLTDYIDLWYSDNDESTPLHAYLGFDERSWAEYITGKKSLSEITFHTINHYGDYI